MWRRSPPPLFIFACFVGLGPPVGGLIAFLLMPLDEGVGNDAPADIVTLMLWGAYIIGLLPALDTAAAATLLWWRRAGPVPYLAICCAVGGVCAAASIILLVLLGTLETQTEVRQLTVYMAACGLGAALLPALATLPGAEIRDPT
jgi:hypothetical protein